MPATAHGPQGQQRAALVTGASSGIGLGIAHVLGQEGYRLTIVARRPEKLETAAQELRGAGHEVQAVAGDVGLEEVVQDAVRRHRERFGRLDALVNNAGVGAGEDVERLTTKKVDLQLATNLRSTILFYRECTELLKAAGAEHRCALVVNTASIAGKHGSRWLSVYSATKAGVVGFTQAMHDELSRHGIKNTALCPGYVDTPMTDFVKGEVASQDMIRVSDIAETVRALLRMSPGCIVPEVQFLRPGVPI